MQRSAVRQGKSQFPGRCHTAIQAHDWTGTDWQRRSPASSRRARLFLHWPAFSIYRATATMYQNQPTSRRHVLPFIVINPVNRTTQLDKSIKVQLSVCSSSFSSISSLFFLFLESCLPCHTLHIAPHYLVVPGYPSHLASSSFINQSINQSIIHPSTQPCNPSRISQSAPDSCASLTSQRYCTV